MKLLIATATFLATIAYAENEKWKPLNRHQDDFLKEYVSIMQWSDTNAYVKLVHPTCREYFEQHDVTLLTSLPFEHDRKGYRVEESWICAYISDETLESMVVMPLTPTHMMKIKFLKDDTEAFYDIVALSYADGKYWINRAYPKPGALDLLQDEDE